MQQLASYAELEVPKDVVDDIQARHMLKKVLVESLARQPPHDCEHP